MWRLVAGARVMRSKVEAESSKEGQFKRAVEAEDERDNSQLRVTKCARLNAAERLPFGNSMGQAKVKGNRKVQCSGFRGGNWYLSFGVWFCRLWVLSYGCRVHRGRIGGAEAPSFSSLNIKQLGKGRSDGYCSSISPSRTDSIISLSKNSSLRASSLA